MNRSRFLGVLALVASMLTASGCMADYSDPPSVLQQTDLAGTWEARYTKREVDTLILKPDGTFKQVYQDKSTDDYTYQTTWNQWWIEHFSDGRVRIHLIGARYYKDGIRIAELDGMGAACPEDLPDCRSEPLPRLFYDPIAEEPIQMPGELVLNVEMDSSGQPVLLHMVLSSDHASESLIGGVAGFERVESH
jgi:hypothetical protein